MKLTIVQSFVLGLVVAVIFAGGAAEAELLVYEGFDYDVGPLTGQNGGTGFSSSWQYSDWSAAKGKVWDETTNVVYDNRTLNWDGAVNNVPTSPATGARYAGAENAGGSSDVRIKRTLSSSAADLAGADGVLWMSAVYHFPDRGYGAGINIGLGNGKVSDRGRKHR